MIRKKQICSAAILFLIACLLGAAAGMPADEPNRWKRGRICRDYGLQVQDRTITIPGLQGSYDFLYIADTHCIVKTTERIDPWDTTTDDRIRSFSNGLGMSSAEQFPGWIRLANAYDADALLMGGDIIDYLSEENVQLVKDHLSDLQTDYLYAMGNHDSVDILNLYGDDGDGGYVDDSPLIRDFFIDGDCECQVLDYGEFCVCSVNNHGSAAFARVSERALEEFRQVCAKGKPVILICHVPFGTESTSAFREAVEARWGNPILMGTDPSYQCDGTTREFCETVLAENSPVVAILSGHVHFFHEDSVNERIIQYVSDTSSNGNGLHITVRGE